MIVLKYLYLTCMSHSCGVSTPHCTWCYRQNHYYRQGMLRARLESQCEGQISAWLTPLLIILSASGLYALHLLHICCMECPLAVDCLTSPVATCQQCPAQPAQSPTGPSDHSDLLQTSAVTLPTHLVSGLAAVMPAEPTSCFAPVHPTYISTATCCLAAIACVHLYATCSAASAVVNC